MKKLYYYKIKEFVNDIEYSNCYKDRCYTQLRYGEPKQLETIKVDNFDDFLALEIYTPAVLIDYTIFNKPYLKCFVSLFNDKIIHRKNFHNYRQEKELCLANAYDYTFKELMETLPSEEFIDWCLDNKLKIKNDDVNEILKGDT